MAVHTGRPQGDTAEDVAPADDDPHLNPEFEHFLNVFHNGSERLTVDAEGILPHQRFAGKLQKNAFVLGFTLRVGHSRLLLIVHIGYTTGRPRG